MSWMQLNCGNAAKVPQELRSMRRLQWVSTGRSARSQDDTGAIPQKAAWRLVMPKKNAGSSCGDIKPLWANNPHLALLPLKLLDYWPPGLSVPQA